MHSLKGKRIVLGVAGGIAAYKAAALTSKLTQAGALVHVMMTKNALEFVQPVTFQALSHQPVHTDTFQEPDPHVISHIDLADRADLVLIAPATANVIGKMANGIADDMLTTTVSAGLWLGRQGTSGRAGRNRGSGGCPVRRDGERMQPSKRFARENGARHCGADTRENRSRSLHNQPCFGENGLCHRGSCEGQRRSRSPDKRADLAAAANGSYFCSSGIRAGNV
jgi:hypothetical protein